MKPNASYLCANCKIYFESEYDKQLKRYRHPTNCPECNSLYFEWVNYRELFENEQKRLG